MSTASRPAVSSSCSAPGACPLQDAPPADRQISEEVERQQRRQNQHDCHRPGRTDQRRDRPQHTDAKGLGERPDPTKRSIRSVAQLLPAVDCRTDGLSDRRRERHDRQDDHDEDGCERAAGRRQRGPRATPPATAQPPGKGDDGRRDHAGEHDRNHDERGLGHNEHCDRRDPQSGEQPPAPLGQAIDPSRHLNIWIGLRIRLERIDGGPAQGDRDRRDRNRGEETDDARHRSANRQRDEHERGVQVDRPPIDDRAEEIV